MPIFEFAGHTLDVNQGRLRNGAGDVLLRPKSLALLTYFLEHPGRIIDKNELIDVVWPNVAVSDDSLSQCLKDIRSVLGPSAEGLIRTVPRRGYILDENRLRIVAEIRKPQPSPPAAASTKPSIAVMPFETENAGHEWFSNGIAEDIITALTKSRRLYVVSKNYSFAFKGGAMRGDEIARELGVRYLLEGGVRLQDQQVRVSTRLVEAGTGELLWGERFDQRLENVFAIQDEIAEAVVRHLELELLPEERQAMLGARTGNIEAYHHELRARQLALELTRSSLLLARRLYAKAVEFDPGYARALAGMVICDCYLRDWHGEKIASADILHLAEAALRLDDTLAEAHAARGFALFCNERLDLAEAAYARALAIDANSYDANFFFASTVARVAGDRERLVAGFGKASRLRPEDYLSPMMVASALDRDDPERARWARIALERSERHVRLHPENAAPLHRGAICLAYLGEGDKALDWIERALAIDPDDFVAQYNAACIHAVLGDPERALLHLARAVRDVSQNTIDMIRNDRDFETIRTDPRYHRLMLPRNNFSDCGSAT